MASRKDFVQRKRNGSSASPNRPAAKPRAKKAAPVQRKKKPWGLALISLTALAGLIYLLNSLVSIDAPTEVANQAPPAANPAVEPKKPAPTQKVTPAKPIKPIAQEKAPVSNKAAVDSTASVKVVEKSSQAEATDAPNRYEFYDLLPKSEITPEEVAAYKSTPRTAKLEKKYVLQAASFRNASDAEKMRAQLLLSGLNNVHTNRSEGSNGTWYRVRVGPFDNRSEMNKAHDKLARMNISPMAVGID